MRVNVYGEELTDKVEIVKKAVDQKLFVGIRFYLKSHPDLHHSFDDNDESAITLWVPYTAKGGNDFARVERILWDARAKLLDIHATAHFSVGETLPK